MSEWKNVFKKEPPRNLEILFLTGDGEIHIGEVWGDEKIRKCTFRCFLTKDDYDCDGNTKYEDRVLFWRYIPPIPELKPPENHE